MSIHLRSGVLCTVMLSAGLACPAAAQVARAPGVSASRMIRLRSATFDTRTKANLKSARAEAFEPDRPYVVQIDRPITPDKRAALERAGVRLGQYLPDNAYLARLGHADPQELAGMPVIQWIGRYEDAWKIDPQIGRREVPFATPERIFLQETGKVQLIVTLFTGRDLDATMEEISLTGAGILGGVVVGGQGHIDLITDAKKVQDLARLAAIQYVEEAPEPVMRNDTNEWILQSNVSGQTPVWEQSIHGEGQIGGIIDGPMRESHCSFDDSVPPGPAHRKVYYYSGSIGADSHGTHVSGTMAGDQTPHGQASFRDGIAFAAKLTFIPVSPIYSSPSTFILRLQDAHDPYGTGEGARMHSNSWGDDGTTSYTLWCRHIDQFSRDNEDDVVCFAVTNMSTLKTPENAKNVLAVGASRDTPNQSSHCSGGTGPTSDGRRKPEIYAPGCSTQSSNSGSSCSWTPMTGTSMACPAITGAGLLVRQYFVDGFYPSGAASAPDSFIPSGALIRATLLNAAVDMTGVSGYPSNREGWGRLLLDNSLYFSSTSDTRKLFVDDIRNADGLSTGEAVPYNVVVLDDSVPLRITLVWTDVPATVGTGFAPINDLDLEVTAPGGELYKGNVFNTSTGESQTGGSRDDRNNVEQVHRLVPALGAYTVTVTAAAVPQETQGYALVVTGGIAITPPDCNGNGIPDDEDIAGGTSQDCDGNTVPDECDPDCDGDNTPDACETTPDCNGNNLPDDCDIAEGTSPDCNGNGIPDECDLPGGTSADCNGNDIPDECDISAGTSEDCNGNNVPDSCDMTGGTSSDCNGNFVPDECDIALGSSGDCNGNTVPDECDMNPIFTADSGPLSPFYNTSPQSYVVLSPPPALGIVTLDFEAVGDLNWATEYVDVDINATPIGTIFTEAVGQCAETPDAESIVLTAAVYNNAVSGGDATINMVPSAGVNDMCPEQWISVSMDYLADNPADCNGNGMPDECEPDADGDQVIDACDACPNEPALVNPSEPDGEITCDDLIDNDCDGLTDGVDSDCGGPACPHPCGDVNGDGAVDLADFVLFANCVGFPPSTSQECQCSELNGDQTIDLADFVIFSGLFGSSSTNTPPDCP